LGQKLSSWTSLAYGERDKADLKDDWLEIKLAMMADIAAKERSNRYSGMLRDSTKGQYHALAVPSPWRRFGVSA
jgi:hypothetical protein